MADAYQDFWHGNFDGAIASAEAALAIDPVNVHAVRFLALLCGKAKSPKAEQYRALYKELDDRE